MVSWKIYNDDAILPFPFRVHYLLGFEASDSLSILVVRDADLVDVLSFELRC